MRTVTKNCMLVGLLLLANVLLGTSQREYNWGKWEETSRYKGIDYRVRPGDYNQSARKYRWEVEFRNRYQKTLHISVNLAASERTNVDTTERLEIEPDEFEGTYFLLAVTPSERVSVFYDKVRLGSDTGPYYQRDK